MLSFFNPTGELFAANLDSTQASIQKIQTDISSGVTISQPEDSPDEISQLLQLQASLAHNTQIQKNLQNGQSTAQAGDEALSSAIQLMDQASALGAEQETVNTTAQNRQSVAQQVQTILQQMVSLSQTTLGGNYVFGGDQNQTASYQYNPSSPTGVDRLIVQTSTAQLEDTSGETFQSGLTAGQIFDARNPDDSISTNNVFNALNSLATALNNNDTTGIQNAEASLSQASTWLNTQQGFYGALENRITSALDQATSINNTLTEQISSIRDTDLTSAAVQLTQAQTQLEASLQSEAKMPQTSLFNFLA